ncbi:MAG: Flp pilus assembly complex ATPase component TadA [Gemmatimonadetes bacterium]|nr:Flp pilus assembly complex ATPase component TadA [Gemmatimonadota bacterium]
MKTSTKPQAKKQIGDLLVEAGLLTQEDLKNVLREQKSSGKRLGELLVTKKFCTEAEIATGLSIQLGVTLVDMKNAPVEPSALELMNEKLARKHTAMPIAIEGRNLTVAFADPLDFDAIESLQFATGTVIQPVIATAKGIGWAIDKHYRIGDSVDKIVKDISSTKKVELVSDLDMAKQTTDLTDLRNQSEAAPVIRMVNHIISTAVDRGASDIHIEPGRDLVVVRNRVDGHLRIELELPKWVQGALISRIKIMAKMDIAEKRLPQDGRFGVKISGDKYDFRASTLPANFGEKIVIRILDSASVPKSMDQLGLEEAELKKLMSVIRQPQGIVLVTGPTGSGKTTTLYAALSEIKSVEKNVTTLEDPIEYELDGINQIGINEKAGRTFPVMLPSILRQDPDVIMVGEMRDCETAMIAMQGSLTGHLVLTTIHTNHTLATITRLRDLGIPSYMIASTITGIVAQRLVRRICESCRTEVPADPDMLSRLGISPKNAEHMKLFEGKGCANCGNTGYQGRVGIYEMLLLTPRLREQIANDAPESTIKQLALAEGLVPLRTGALDKMLRGITTASEVLRVVQMDDAGSICPSCHDVVSSDFAACPSCGTRIVDSCGECRHVVDMSWKFCGYCAAPLAGQRRPRTTDTRDGNGRFRTSIS